MMKSSSSDCAAYVIFTEDPTVTVSFETEIETLFAVAA